MLGTSYLARAGVEISEATNLCPAVHEKKKEATAAYVEAARAALKVVQAKPVYETVEAALRRASDSLAQLPHWHRDLQEALRNDSLVPAAEAEAIRKQTTALASGSAVSSSPTAPPAPLAPLVPSIPLGPSGKPAQAGFKEQID